MALVYGLDTGSWKLRLAAMEGSFGRFALRDVQEVAVLPDQGGGVPLAEALKAVREAEPKWAEGDRAAAFPLDLGVVRLVKLPFADKNAIARAVPAEVEAQAPFDLEDMVLVSRVLDTREGASRSVVHIAPRDDLRARIDALRAASAEPRFLCLDVAALAAYADRGVQVVLDVGHRRTLLAVCQGGQLVAGRLVPVGGEALTLALAAASGLDATQAEALKHQSVVPLGPVGEWEGDDRTETTAPVVPMGGAGPAEVLRQAVEAQVAVIRAELIAVEDELGLGVDELLLAGGGSRLGGLPEILTARLGVPVRPVVVPGGYPPDCALAVALARVAAGEVKAADLRVDDLAYRGAAELLWTVVSVSTVAAVTALAAGIALFTVRYLDGQDRLAELQAKMVEVVTSTYADIPAERVTDGSTAVAIMQERAAATQERVDKLGSIVGGLPPMLEMLREVSNGVPRHSEARIDVRELTIAEDSVSMKAETDSYETAAKIESALKSVDGFKDARKSDEKKTGEALTFSLTIPLGAESETTGEEG